MRRVNAAAALIGLGLFVAAPGAAAAQGFFDGLFGGAKAQPVPQAQPQFRPHDSAFGYRTMIARSSRDGDAERGHSANGSHENGDRSGRYRTVCVRLCDGFYWPISGAAHRSGFYRDANICKASCGEETRLFFHSASSGDTKEMVDVSGRPYTRLASAFLYRKTTVDNCKCKPNPWAQSEIDRHRLYALNETDAERRKRMGLPAFEIASADAAVGRVIGTAPVTAIGKAARLTLPSDPAVAARFASPSETKPADPAEQPAEFKATASSSGDDPAATPGPEKKPGLETAERPAALSGKRRAVAGSERRQAVAQPNVRRTSPAYAQKPAKSGFGGMFGLGAGAQKRWPGE